MSNSSLVSYIRISPNSNNPRNHKIDKITIHHCAGNASLELLGDMFGKESRQASSNYGISTDGRVGMFVEEHNRAWTSGSASNDHRAITIEVSNDEYGGNWHVSDIALAKLIDLCVDICQRNNIASLNFTGDANGNLTMHKYFQNTDCPGAYLESKFPYIASEVNKRLGGSTPAPTPTPTPTPSTNPNRSTGALFTCTGLWTQANGGTYYSASQLLHGKGDYTIGKVHTGAEHPYEALKNGVIIGFANDKCIDDEPSLPSGSTSSSSQPTRKSNEEIANEVIAGKWSTGTDRKNKLTSAGYDYNTVQNIVNQKLGAGTTSSASMSARDFALKVWNGTIKETGEARKAKASSLGVDYAEAQRLINILASGGSI